ncbi:hypothetical protein [Haloarcula montana]|uniref:hypothetical protein n=1 Tax=Haloarcula montana TaxID=3111776 RepID=UPI002D7762C9|nr:hypothetical protein [Haloarcula sp. GH36]
MSDNDTPKLGRRQVLRTIGSGTALSVGGLGVFAGNATAWDRKDVDFKGCSEVWLIVGADDIAHDPPTVVRVVVARPDGSTDCRDVELTAENTSQIPGQYGDAPVRKVTAEDGEKVLGVIFYNYRSADRFASASCIHTNDHRCVSTPGTPSLEDAPCVQSAREIGGYDCSTTESGRGRKGRPGNARPGRGRRRDRT